MNFDDLKYLFNTNQDDSVDVYKQDTTKNKQISERISLFNKNFSETFLKGWIGNIVLRYIYLCSKAEEADKLNKFELMHLANGASSNCKESMKQFASYTNISVKFIDFLDYIHTDETEVLTLKVCLICSNDIIPNVDTVNEEDIKYVDIIIAKNNTNANSIEKQDTYTSNCPCCGAPTQISTIGVCDHCKELISIYDNVWKIRDIELT